MKLLRVIISDLHLGTGARKGQFNPFEDFYQDERFVEFADYYSSGEFEAAEVELILNGDIFDLMKVEIDGAWPTAISENVAVEKMRRCLEGHPRVVASLKMFLARPGKRITYIPGNHDMDIVFPAVQQLLRTYLAPGALSQRLRFVTATESYSLPEGIQIRHGHQFEAIHRFDYRRLTVEGSEGSPVLNLPWGSLFCLEILNPAKRHRHHIDHVVPFRRFLLGALFFDFRFMLVFCLRMALHFLRKRLSPLGTLREKMKALPQLIKEEIFAISDFDGAAIKALRRLRGVHTLIVGHSHGAKVRVVENGKVYVNTGTWVRMINLDIEHLGQENGLTYALVEYDTEGQPQTSLMRWTGMGRACEPVAYQA